MYSWNQRQKLVTNEKCRYLKAIYSNPCDGSQDYPNYAVRMLTWNNCHIIMENYEGLFCLCAT